jgi:hypothetical protein
VEEIMAGRLWLLACASLCILSFGCAPSDTVIVDRMESLKDGTGVSFKLDPGTYKVDVTASNDGVTVKFIGSSCPGAEKETQNFSTICELTQTGQVTIDNPSTFGAGSGSTVTVKITKLGRS